MLCKIRGRGDLRAAGLEGGGPMVQRRRGFGRLRRERSGRYSAAYVGPDLRLYRAPETFRAKIDAEG